ncbi:hypothetical protein M0Q97_03935 [Candidatus Dojkabacteria bacterium]|jgi:hypothetical protein|nr:hypothetical protein [Candidatus Dojkabacteria bacterium]
MNIKKFEIVNFLSDQKDEDKYGEYIINKFFKDEEFAKVKIKIDRHKLDVIFELSTFNLNSQKLISISKYCEFVDKIGNYQFYVEGSGDVNEDSVFGIESAININNLEKIIKVDKYNL